jgi:hypothetical protein
MTATAAPAAYRDPGTGPIAIVLPRGRHPALAHIARHTGYKSAAAYDLASRPRGGVAGWNRVYTQLWPYRTWLAQEARRLNSDARVDVASVEAVRAQAAADHVSDSQLAYALAG